MPEHANATLLRDFYESAAKGDLSRLGELLADDVVFHVPGRGALAGDHEGKNAVLQFMGRVNEATGGGLRLEPHTYLASEDYAVALVRVRGDNQGRALEDHGVQVFRIEGGKIRERRSYPGDLYQTDEFFA